MSDVMLIAVQVAGFLLLLLLVVFLVVRVFWLWYWRVDEQVELLKAIAKGVQLIEERQRPLPANAPQVVPAPVP